MFMKWIMCSIAVLFLASCSYNTGVVQSHEQGFIKFMGDWQNATVVIDKSEPIELKYYYPEESHSAEGSQTQAPVTPAKVYAISPGKHLVKVYAKDGSLVVKRSLFIGNQQTMEVRIP